MHIQKLQTSIVSGVFALAVTAILILNQAVFLFWPNDQIFAQGTTDPNPILSYTVSHQNINFALNINTFIDSAFLKITPVGGGTPYNYAMARGAAVTDYSYLWDYSNIVDTEYEAVVSVVVNGMTYISNTENISIIFPSTTLK